MPERTQAGVVRLAPADCGWGASVLGRAFENYPLYRHVLPPAPGRLAKVAWIQKSLLAYGCRYGEAWGDAEKSGVLFWLPRGDSNVSLWRLIRSGMLAAPFVLGPAATFRLNRASDFMEAIRRKVLPEPHHYLFNLGTDPAAQGRGTATALMAPFLARVAAAGGPSYLETLAEKNLRFYERFGFTVASCDEIPGAGIKTWAMIRE